MRKWLFILYIGSLAGMASAREATFVVTDRLAERVGDELVISMRVDIGGMDIPKDHSVVCVPMVEAGDSARALPAIVLNGKTRHILYERLERPVADPPAEYVYRVHKGEPRRIDYTARVPYADWMESARVSLVMDDCGCGWESLSSERSPLFALDLRPVTLEPRALYVTPEAEAVKARSLAGSAFLDFPVNRVEIHPDYRDNPAELAKIRATIDEVRANRFATITAVTIRGYASPEGAYAANARLAEGRARALMEYVRKLYPLEGARWDVTSEPEDWAGLERAVEASDLADKDELLAIIRAPEPADWDAREWRLKSLNGGASYRRLLNEIYPALRHSDYEVDYTIRDFTVDEAAELAFTDPAQLSLNEFFRVANTLEPGSERFNEVFEIAVRMYPDDPVSNLNAAVTAIGAGQYDKARAYLAKAADGPEKRLAEAALAMYEGDLDRAEAVLRPLVDDARVGAAASDNLEQIARKRAKERR